MSNDLNALIKPTGEIAVSCPNCDMGADWGSLVVGRAEWVWEHFHRRHRRYHPAWYMDFDEYFTFDDPDPNIVHEKVLEPFDRPYKQDVLLTCKCGFYQQTKESEEGLAYLDKKWDAWHSQYEEQARTYGGTDD